MPHLWFWNELALIKPMFYLIKTYHETVGRNCVLELDFAIDRDGLVGEKMAKQYKKFGDWIHNCYSNGSVNSTKGYGNVFTLDIPADSIIDRVVI